LAMATEFNGKIELDIRDSEPDWGPYAAPTAPEGAPNILYLVWDDTGIATWDCFGGLVDMPTMSRIAERGVRLSQFHTTALCSPTRASLLTGRNATTVGMATIEEFTDGFPNCNGRIPADTALLSEVLNERGYNTYCVGKWHLTPLEESNVAATKRHWPLSRGFERFYGFMGGETDQWYPDLVYDNHQVAPPATPEEGYHLSKDLADKTNEFIRDAKAVAPDKPWFSYLCPGAGHAPHHVFKEWADKYAGKCDDGWDAYRERVFARAKEQGWIPAEAQLTPRDPQMQAWDDVPEEQRPFQRRLMEVAAGYAEHADVQAGRVIDEIERLGVAENTLIFYIWGDNGSSGEGQNGTISELLAQNGIPTTVDMHINTLEEMGGLDLLGTPKVDNQYHAGWAWAGSTPYSGLKLMASDLGGTRNPMAVRWPAKIAPDATPRTQFHHCNDVVPTIYELAGITPPRVVHGVPQDPIDGTSFAYALHDPDAPGRLITQYFEIMGSRAIYHDGWMASATGPRRPWVPGRPPGIEDWTPDHDQWRLYNLDEDWSQANDLAAEMPEKLAQMKETFAIEAARNSVYPIGGGLWVLVYHPELRISTPYREWNFGPDITRMPEFCAPALGNRANLVTVNAELPENANGVLYALGSSSGGLTCYLDDGHLCYEYNLFIIQRTKIRSEQPMPAGPAKIEISTEYAEVKPGGPLNIKLTVNGEPAASGVVPISAPLLFTANDCLDIGTCLGGPVSLDYYERAPFPFTGTIDTVNVRYTS
jgi:arylsulfatase A-like enzyme